jgi:hypothetical protein
MTLQYYTKNHFGIDRMYIADPEQARAFYMLTQRKIILPEHIEALSMIGITLERVNNPTQ